MQSFIVILMLWKQTGSWGFKLLAINKTTNRLAGHPFDDSWVPAANFDCCVGDGASKHCAKTWLTLDNYIIRQLGSSKTLMNLIVFYIVLNVLYHAVLTGSYRKQMLRCYYLVLDDTEAGKLPERRVCSFICLTTFCQSFSLTTYIKLSKLFQG